MKYPSKCSVKNTLEITHNGRMNFKIRPCRISYQTAGQNDLKFPTKFSQKISA